MFKPTDELNLQADLILLNNKEVQLVKSYFLYLDLKDQDFNSVIYFIKDYKSYTNYLRHLNKTYGKNLRQIMYIHYNKYTILCIYIYDEKIMF